MTKPKVLVSRRWPAAVEAELENLYDVTFNIDDIPMTVDGFKSAMQEYDAILPTVTDKITADVFADGTHRTKILGNFGVGYSHIDTDAAKTAGVIVTNTPDVLSDCTADIALTLMLATSRRAGEGERELRSGNWTGWRPTHMVGHRMTGKTLGIIGFGRIGQEVAKRAHFGFGMKVLVQNRSPVKNDTLIKTNACQVGGIDDLLERSDYISLHCPGGEENRHLIGKKQFAKMKSNSFLINTARGEVVDEDALAAALKNGQIAGAGLDVFDGEPNINPALLECENAVLLPHLGSATYETREAMGFRVLDNIAAFFSNNEPQDRVV